MKEIEITNIKDFKIGHAQDDKGGTGCTVILCEKGAYAGVDVRGGGPATRETDLLNPVNKLDKIHAVMLSGGSAYGLDACSGAMAYLEEKGVGFEVGIGVVPIVCGASLFDLIVGDSKCRPDKEMGYEACKNSESRVILEGNVGAGTGATVGKLYAATRMMKSGLGIYAAQIGDLQVGAIVAVNALGDVIDFENGKQIAGLLNTKGTNLSNTEEELIEHYAGNLNVFSGNTTIGCIITNANLSKSQANKIASIAHNGYAKAIRPVHTMADGDTVFVMATGVVDAMPDAVGAIAVQVMAKAINRAVWKAEPAYGLKAASDFKP